MDRMLIVFIGVFFLVLGAFGVALFTGQIERQVRATNPPPADSTNSILISSTQLPVQVGEQITISAVARATDNAAVPEAEICLTSSLGTVTPPCEQSDAAGITKHTLTSQQTGIATVQGTINGTIPIGTTVAAEFVR